LLIGPLALRIEWHELDETNGDALFTTKGSEIDNFILIHTAHDNTVDFYGRQTCSLCRSNTFKHTIEFVTASDLFETITL